MKYRYDIKKERLVSEAVTHGRHLLKERRTCAMVSKLIPKTVAALVAGLVVLVVMGAYSPIGAQAQKTEIKVGFSMALSGRQAPAAEVRCRRTSCGLSRSTRRAGF